MRKPACLPASLLACLPCVRCPPARLPACVDVCTCCDATAAFWPTAPGGRDRQKRHGGLTRSQAVLSAEWSEVVHWDTHQHQNKNQTSCAMRICKACATLCATANVPEASASRKQQQSRKHRGKAKRRGKYKTAVTMKKPVYRSKDWAVRLHSAGSRVLRTLDKRWKAHAIHFESGRAAKHHIMFTVFGISRCLICTPACGHSIVRACLRPFDSACVRACVRVRACGHSIGRACVRACVRA
jgi:hypothetical protein